MQTSNTKKETTLLLNSKQLAMTAHYSLMLGPSIRRCVSLLSQSKYVMTSSTLYKLKPQIQLPRKHFCHKSNLLWWQIFHFPCQAEGESIPHFLARVQAQAKFCSFTVDCPNIEGYYQQIIYSCNMISIPHLFKGGIPDPPPSLTIERP